MLVQTVTVYAGGNDSRISYAGEVMRFFENNNGDAACLKDAEGNLVDKWKW